MPHIGSFLKSIFIQTFDILSSLKYLKLRGHVKSRAVLLVSQKKKRF